ncbi:MAG: LysM peptidoglycan-binding domain-containing protein [Nitrospinae bacterium]|nr:LysM peptidoglycan-binding domain-containing protein [Nitrospinota bacterium]
MKKAFLFMVSFLFVLSLSSRSLGNPAAEETGISREDVLEQADAVLSEEQADSEVSAEEDATLFKELSSPDANLFHVPSSLRSNVNFWKRIYTEFTTNQMVIHDKNNLNIVYDAVDINNGGQISNKMRRAKIGEAKRRYRNILIGIHNKIRRGEMLNGEEIGVYKKFEGIAAPDKFIAAAENIRGQLGQKDRFIAGLKRSGRYIGKIKEIFRYYGLPEELTALPNVESSFNYDAYSSAGAAGIWQFTRSTGRLFMQIDYVVDERRDPILSTVAAAKLLRRNYESLGSWPLAIIAYNHGLNGMKKAKERIGDNVTDVINGYRSRIFGFASKNFYCEFLAALEIVKDHKRYFGDIEFEKPADYDVFRVDSYLDITGVSRHTGVSINEIKSLNPALRPPVFASKRYIPKGFEMKVPKGKLSDTVYTSLPKIVKKETQKHSPWHLIEAGDTVSSIARRYKIATAAIMDMNEIDNVNRIYPGQTLKLPEAVFGQSGSKGEMKIPAQNVVKAAVKPLDAKDKIKPPAVAQEKGGSPEFLKPVVSKANLTVYEVNIPDSSNTKKSSYGFINVEPDETIGHYADWSGLAIQKIKDINGLKRGAVLKTGQKIKIYFTSVTKEGFEEKRAEHHLAIQEDFFSNYNVEGTTAHAIKRGETIWKIASENEIPLWLLKRYNPDKNFRKLAMGESFTLPVISKVN